MRDRAGFANGSYGRSTGCNGKPCRLLGERYAQRLSSSRVPIRKMLIDALISRSWCVLHLGQSHCRIFNPSTQLRAGGIPLGARSLGRETRPGSHRFSTMCPQLEHRYFTVYHKICKLFFWSKNRVSQWFPDLKYYYR